jgi:hypothetical protein
MKNLLLFFAFVCLCFSCKENKTERKVIDNQIDTLKYFSPEKAFWQLRQQANVPDTVSFDFLIDDVKNYEMDSDKLLFIYLNHYSTIADFDLKQDLYVLRWEKTQWNVVDSVKLSWIPYTFETIDTVQLTDVDFDGQEEIVLRFASVSGSRNNCPYEFLKYDKNTKQIKHFYSVSDSLDQSMPNSSMSINPQEKTILFGGDGGNFLQWKTISHWQSDTLQAIKDIAIIYHSEKMSRIEERKLENLRWKVIQNKIYNNDKAWAYFEKWQ